MARRLALFVLALCFGFAQPDIRHAAAQKSGSHLQRGPKEKALFYKARVRQRRGPPRSSKARRDFMRRTGYPQGRPRYVIDHIVRLACGGKDDPSNMQWQTRAEAKAKDRWEQRGCRGSRAL